MLHSIGAVKSVETEYTGSDKRSIGVAKWCTPFQSGDCVTRHRFEMVTNDVTTMAASIREIALGTWGGLLFFIIYTHKNVVTYVSLFWNSAASFCRISMVCFCYDWRMRITLDQWNAPKRCTPFLPVVNSPTSPDQWNAALGNSKPDFNF